MTSKKLEQKESKRFHEALQKVQAAFSDLNEKDIHFVQSIRQDVITSLDQISGSQKKKA